MTNVKKVILTGVALLMPMVASGDFAVKFFPGWHYRHQDDQIHDGVTLWAIIKQGDSYMDNRLYLSSFADAGNFVKEVGRYTDGE